MSRRPLRWFVSSFVAVAILSGSAVCLAKSCGPPAPATPQRRTGGESFPPLPLPATPLRRTEKKRPPAPPALVGKIQYGKIVWTTDAQGRRTSYRDWTTDPNDINRLVSLTNQALGIRYRPVHTTFEDFSYNPAEIPILYLTGHEAFSLSEEQRKALYWFINDGGYLLGDACCGSDEFSESFMAEMRLTFERQPLRLLPSDHPIYTAHYSLPEVEVMVEGKAMGKMPPRIYGLNVGCRTAVFLTTYDLSCGWDGHEHPTGKRVRIADARRLGVNIMAYSLANYQLGRFLSTQRIYHEEDENTRDEFVFAQVIHDGDWEPCPNGIMSLMRYVSANSTMPVQFKRVGVNLGSAEILRHPMLYMTGHEDFTLTDAEVAGLRNYLRNGGLLFGNACCGRQAFDAAFRREIARVLPEGMELQPIPLEHPVYKIRTPVDAVHYTHMLTQRDPELNAPTLEGVSIEGQLAIVYSKYGLGTAWDGQERPYSLAYESDDALRIGMNILLYAMTH